MDTDEDDDEDIPAQPAWVEWYEIAGQIALAAIGGLILLAVIKWALRTLSS